MDKETLSNYGWIVICVLVLAVMVALATPFGSYVASAVENTTQGLFETEQTALGVVGLGQKAKIEMLDGAGQTYAGTGKLVFRSAADFKDFKEVRVDGAVVDDSHYEVTEGSTVVTFNENFSMTLADGTHTVEIISNTGTASADFKVGEPTPEELIAQGIIPENGTYYVNATPEYDGVTGDYTRATATYTAGQTMPTPQKGDVFVYGDYEYRYDCYSLIGFWQSYDVTPNGTHNSLEGTWGVCVLDNSKTSYKAMCFTINSKEVSNLSSTYFSCYNLTEIPELPKTIKHMDYTFQDCTSLTGDIEINATPTSFNCCLQNTQITSISGSCSQEIKDAILATK